jgi:hypothetical protein
MPTVRLRGPIEIRRATRAQLVLPFRPREDLGDWRELLCIIVQDAIGIGVEYRGEEYGPAIVEKADSEIKIIAEGWA